MAVFLKEEAKDSYHQQDDTIKKSFSASVIALQDCKSTSLRNTFLLDLHCVLKDDFAISIVGIKGIELICCQVHLSFVDKISKRH